FLKQKGFLAYFEILELLSQKKIFQKKDLLTNTMYGYNAETKEWVSFDTPETTRLKIQEAKRRGLGGVIFWAINLDDYQTKPRFPNIRQAL
ncbi:MAG: glycosyl hydrolase family 18 protein, partial [Chlamydiota bacterium]